MQISKQAGNRAGAASHYSNGSAAPAARVSPFKRAGTRTRLVANVFGAASALVIPVSVAQAPLSQDAQDRLEQGLPGVQIDSVQLSPVRGVYEARVGAQVFYLTEDGKYAFMGDLIDIDTQTNLAEQSRRKVRAQLVETAGEDTMIVFAPAKPIRTVSVFTDVDCPYCAKFHLDVPKLVAGGVKIRYLAYPRTGVGSESYQRAVSVWCADDPRRAMGEAKAGKSLATNTCVNPVADHFRLGQEIAVKGTPTLVLDDGSMITGYISPDRLFTALGMMPVETVDPSKRGTDR